MTDPFDILSACAGFEWDAGNATKNWKKHRVSQAECEEVFFHSPLIAAADLTHSRTEPRYVLLGQTSQGRPFAVVFTVRGTLIRVISALDAHRTERQVYAAYETENPRDS